MSKAKTSIEPSPFLKGVRSYNPKRSETPIDLFLDSNEGMPPSRELFDQALKAGPELASAYPKKEELETKLARFLDIEPDRIVVAAGADDALERIIRSVAAPAREVIVPVPTFAMIPRYAALTGCDIIEIPWMTPSFPLRDVLSEVREKTALIVLVTPSSPFGFSIAPSELIAISKNAKNALLLLDLAYTEFADNDLTQLALSLPNVVITRTMSKALGLAGLRVGYAAGPREVVDWLRAVGHPYAVASLSIALAAARIDRGFADIEPFIGKVKEQRSSLFCLLKKLGALPFPSNGNFVFAQLDDVEWLKDGLAGLGISVRIFPNERYLEKGARITVPGDDAAFKRLSLGLEIVLKPEAIIFDIDDTLVDVSESYKRATIETAKLFGAEVTFDDIAEAKADGNANNDWELTLKLIQKRDIQASLEDVTRVFERLYQGEKDNVEAGFIPTLKSPLGLKAAEKLLIDPNCLKRLKNKIKLGIVTGRPKKDANAFLARYCLTELFDAVITMDDAPLKPDPAPVRLALEKLGVSRAWMIGDTPDDIRAARSAGVVALGVVAPADDPVLSKKALLRAGAGRVLNNVQDVEELLK